MVLEKYSSFLSFFASCFTIPLLLSPILVCKEFMKKGSSDHVKPIVFVGGLMRSILFLQFGISQQLTALIIIHSMGTFLYSIYLSLYYSYCENKERVRNLAGKVSAFVAILLGFVNFKKQSFIAIHFSAIVTIVHLSLIALPLLNIKNIIRTKNTAELPFPIILCANVVSTSWLLYGISINNNTIILQMIIGSILTGIQLSLFVIYPPKPITAEKKKE